MTPDEIVNAVVALHHQKWSHRRIARELGLSRGKVRRILKRIKKQRESGHSVLPKPAQKRASKLDVFDSKMRELLDKYPDITAVRMHEKLGDEPGFDAGYTIVKDWLRAHRVQPKATPVRRFETGPGEQGQMDWSPYKFQFTHADDAELECFSFIFAFSRRQYIDFGPTQDFFSLIRQHVAAFEYMERVPAEILYDNQKTIVLRWEAGRPIYNVRYLAFATHYGFRPRALPPRKPEWKGKIERPFQYVEGNFLNAREFRDLAHLRREARRWMQETSDVHRHDTTNERPIDRFEREKDALIALPRKPYDTARVGYRVLSNEGFVEWDTVKYSFPYEFILELGVVRDTGDEIVIYSSDLKEVARHERVQPGHEPVINPLHHPRKARRNNSEFLTARLCALGLTGAEFAAGVLRTQRYSGVHMAQVLMHAEHYDLDDLLRALARAVRYGAFDAKTVLNILEKTAEVRCLPGAFDAAAAQRLATVAAQAYVTPRSIADYARALKK